MTAWRSPADIRRRPVLRCTLLSLAVLILLAGATAAGCFAYTTHMLGAGGLYGTERSR
ncbi:MAG TPA: hypothetical protein VHZ03_29315 [Trebonia sp.]|jgi:hypothetical protein|nr:hypothetical protein [Trebonia sp.]